MKPLGISNRINNISFYSGVQYIFLIFFSRKHKLKIVLHEWKQVMVAGDPGVPTIGLLVKSSSHLREFSDLRGLKACIPKKYGFGRFLINNLFFDYRHL